MTIVYVSKTALKVKKTTIEDRISGRAHTLLNGPMKIFARSRGQLPNNHRMSIEKIKHFTWKTGPSSRMLCSKKLPSS